MEKVLSISARNVFIEIIDSPFRKNWFERTDCEDENVRKLEAWYRDYFSLSRVNEYFNELRIICPVEHFYRINQFKTNIAAIVPLESLTRSKTFKFPTGHPIANTVYVAHPYNPSVYIPYVNHEIEFIKDKLRELTEIAQDLGAKEIDVKVINETYFGNSTRTSTNYGGSVAANFIGFEGNGNYNKNVNKNDFQYFSHIFNRHQTFKPTSIKEPEDTIWLQGEINWQGIIKQRLKGSLLSHKEILETRQAQAVSNSTLKQFKADIKSIYGQVGLEWSKEEEEMYSVNSNLVVSVDIKFAKIDDIYKEPSELPNILEGLNGIKNKILDGVNSEKLSSFFKNFTKKED
ncbi:MAG: hypothetical protein J1F43_03620 [Muribaculaceae bacterium]|nr:hypothetical protein [Muribaculaceae bacterium]